MNKKFSTLLTGALLVGSVAANATGITVDKVTAIEQLTSGSRYYVLSTAQITTSNPATTVVYMDGADVKVAASVNTPLDEINKQLWSIKVNAVAGANRFVFTNKAEGMTLSFDPANAIDISAGSVDIPNTGDKAYQMTDVETEWSWVTTKDATSELENVAGLAAYFHKDSVMKLYQPNAGGNVFAVKYANTAVSPSVTAAKEVQVQAVQPGTLVLTAADLNVLGEGANKYFTIDAGQTLKGNIFANTKWQAQDIVAKGAGGSVGDNTDPAIFTYEANETSTDKLSATAGTVVLNKIESDKPSFKFAHVDTAFWAGVSENQDKWYQFAVAEGKVTKNSDGDIVTLDSLARKGGLAQKAFEFTFTRDLFKDSVIVTVPAAGLMQKEADLDEVWGKKTYWHTANANLDAYITLSYQKLNDANVLTLDKKDQENNIPFFVSGPAVESTSVSVEDGLYYIKNKAGQFLAAPIYNTTNGTTSDAEWVTVNGGLQEVAHMPAYQWVVLKDRIYSETAKKTSSVTITNREFTETEFTSVQLNRKDEGSCMYINTAFAPITTKDSLVFTQIEDLAILSDTLLGYKNFDADSLLVNRYTFNYLHNYAAEKYIVKSGKDSLALAIDEAQPFVIEAEEDIYDYGYEVTPAIAGRIAGLKQLRRQAYQVYLPTAKGKLYLSKNAENKYMFTLNVPAYGTPSTFLFKEENDLTSNKHYHALVAVTENLGTPEDEAYTKVGVIDASAILEDQEMNEQRTSAFLIGKYDAPLYRRFNSQKLEGNAGDATDTLRFVEKYRKEYLQVEANENFKVKGIDFLGIYTPDFTKDGKSFIVDTAFVNRWGGNIKPQYLIAIDLTKVKGEDAKPCPLTHNHGYDKDGNELDEWTCSHATPAVPGFAYGKYLVNFKDSVDHAAVKSENYGWKGYTRAGFVKAVHMGDSLYILTGQFADVTPATFDAAAIEKAVENKKYSADYIVDLQGDKHKLVTWSMRYVDPAKAANEVEEDRAFLMESQGNDPIAPVEGSWLKMQNGCIVLSGTAGAESTFDQITGDDDALIFNVEQGNKEDMATDNEEIATSEVAVIAQQGAVRIANAEGKKVVVTNILGQVVANTVLSSDNATISTPAGVVVVAVEGEEAVKAIVK